MDVVVSVLGAPAELWLNENPGGNHWLVLSLEGTTSNRDGFGAEIKVVTSAGTQYNHVSTAVGYASSSAGPVHFGLGPDEVAESAAIRWPSGVVQELKKVEGGRVPRINEPAT